MRWEGSDGGVYLGVTGGFTVAQVFRTGFTSVSFSGVRGPLFVSNVF